VGEIGATVLAFGTVTATAVLAGGATAGAASAVVVVVVLLPEVAATGTAGVVAAGVVMVAVTAEGVETAGVGLATTNAAVTESESGPPPPPPPQAVREVATRVERTREISMLDEVFMSIYSELRSFSCCFRLFIVGLWNNSILMQNNRFLKEKVVLRPHNFPLCDRNLTQFPFSLKDCYCLLLSA
jgi:hypothetical protein